MDFTIRIYEKLIKALLNYNYEFITFRDYLQNDKTKFIILRHDVEARYSNALEFAKIQNKFGIRGSYFFRILENHFDSEIVKTIASLCHETGYHYDDLAKCKGNFDDAIKRFEKHIALLNDISPVKTICMDGSPLSKFDNKELWEKYNYRDYGIIGEPYFDIDFNEIFYLTDTGRRWDGEKVSVRDKVKNQDKSSDEWRNVGECEGAKGREGEGVKGRKGEGAKKWLSFHSTNDIIKAAEDGCLPDKIMMTFHPQRWNDKPVPWVKELVWQNIKNVGKRVLVRMRKGAV